MNTFTLIHVLISLAGLLSGFIVLFGFIAGKRLGGWAEIFLATTVATSVTGFFFPYHGFTPAMAFGVISLVVLALAIYALYGRDLLGGWRKVYIISSVIALKKKGVIKRQL